MHCTFFNTWYWRGIESSLAGRAAACVPFVPGGVGPVGAVSEMGLEDNQRVATVADVDDFKSGHSGEELEPFFGRHPVVFAASAFMLLLTTFLLVVVPFTFFQLIALSFSLPLYLCVLASIFFRLKQIGGYGKMVGPRRTLLWAYLLPTAFLALALVIGICQPFFWSNADVETVVLGGVSASGIAFSVYAPGQDTYSVEYKEKGSAVFLTSPTEMIDQVVRLTGLTADTAHEYRIIYADGTEGPNGTFRTLRSAVGSKIKFVSTSCTMKHDTILGSALQGYTRMAEKDPDLDFLLFLGDFVYVDTPWGMGYQGIGYGTDLELYASDYRSTISDDHASKFLSNYPTFFMLDDHEVTNDYNQGNATETYEAAASM